VRSTVRAAPGRVSLVAAISILLLLLAVPAGVRAASYPPLPLADDRGFLGNLSAPYLAPGGSGSVSFTVSDPLPYDLTRTELTLEVYAFNGFPGNATAQVPVAGAPVLSNASASGASVGVSLGLIESGRSSQGLVAVATSDSTPSGTFAVRAALAFTANSTHYLLESRGWFTTAQWTAATELPNGSATLNLSTLGVSGVLPETAVLVEESTFSWLLAGVLVGAFVLVGIGAWVYFRRGPASNSGTRRADDDHQAPKAFGSKRTRDGD
jgi:hypothetical protein